jgi:eukaryotic-like serine/threonine-protein kinase
MKSEDSAAAKLVDLELQGWKVVSKIAPHEGGSGGNFSHHYVAKKDGKSAFVKAMDLSSALSPDEDTVALIRLLTAAYEHERQILLHCRDRRLSKVVLAITHGEVQVPGYDTIAGRAFYLIFDLADGDIRAQVNETKRFDKGWSIRALRDVAHGLWQIHKELIAHQDMKPSNVLYYKNQGFRIADFGRASRRGKLIDHDEFAVAGDRTYSPPELLYGQIDPEFSIRRFGCDVYMLGNLAAFMFAGVNVTSAITIRLDAQFRWMNWSGTYAEVLPYVQAAFTEFLSDLRAGLDNDVGDEVTRLVRELCNPDPKLRGHSRGVGKHDQYSMERYVSELDRMSKQYDLLKRLGRVKA